MKLNLLSGAALATLLFSASAGAQTCASPDISWHPDASGSPTLAASSCEHETSFTSYCDQGGDATGSSYVAKINTSAAATYTQIAVSSNPTDFTAIVDVIPVAQGCGSAQYEGDDGHCITSSSLAVKKVNIPPGEYYLVVHKADFDNADACGNFTLTADGTLPVSLQSFTVG